MSKKSEAAEALMTCGEARRAGAEMILSTAVRIWSSQIDWSRNPLLGDHDWLTIGAIVDEIDDLYADPRFREVLDVLDPRHLSVSVKGAVR